MKSEPSGISVSRKSWASIWSITVFIANLTSYSGGYGSFMGLGNTASDVFAIFSQRSVLKSRSYGL